MSDRSGYKQKVPRRFWTFLTIGLLCFALAGAVVARPLQGSLRASASGGRSWVVTDALYSGQLRGADLQVREAITADFAGRFTGFYRDVPFNEGQQIVDLQVADQRGRYSPGGSALLGSSGTAGSFGEDLLPGRVQRVVWHHDTVDDQNTFLAAYRLQNAAERFEDGDVVRLRVWGNFWNTGAERVQGRLLLPAGVQARLSAGPRWLQPQVEQRGREVLVQAERVPSRQAVDFLAVMPRGALGPGIPEVSGSLPQIPAERLGDRIYRKTTAASRAILWPLLLSLFGLLPAVAWLRRWRRKMQDAPSAPEVVYEPPAGSLAYGYTAAQESAPSSELALTAILIDLVARGLYDRENIRDANGEWRLKISRPQQRPPDPLSAGEAAVLEYIDELLQDGACVVDELDERITQGQQAVDRLGRVKSAILEDAKAATAGQKSKAPTAKLPAILLIWFALILVPMLTMPAHHAFGHFSGILTVISGLVLGLAVVAWPRGDFVRSGPEAMAAAGPWRNWRNFITSFSSMQTAPDLQVILWERAFAGALMFGVAEEFAQRAKLVTNIPESSMALASTSYLSSSLGSSLQSAATPPSSSSSGSGGGFGGGGGGGGGGGAW